MEDKIIDSLKKGILLSPTLAKIELKENRFRSNKAKVEIVATGLTEDNNKKTIKNFINLYNTRFTLLQSILKQRQELNSMNSIRRVKGMDEKERVSFIGMVLDKKTTKNNNIIMTLEDQTGTIKAIITKNNKEAFLVAKETSFDEVIGIMGSKGKGVVFINSIILPDVPLNKELKKAHVDDAALFIGDIHAGASAFLQKNFEHLISWLSGNTGSPEQREISCKIKYLFILGDLVEGVGIFPGQEKDLEIKDIYKQFELITHYLKKIPEHINIIICAGNHDPVRIAEPQPPIPKEFMKEMYDRPNMFFIQNPSLINIAKTEKFPGFNILIYHGYSFPYYASNIEEIRTAGGLESIDKVMVYLLKRRHLAPAHGSTRYYMGYDKDPLVIKTVPDFFVTGHIHRATIKTYRNVTLLNTSCWVSQTDYQEKRGLMPEPNKAIYVNLKTRNTKMLNF